jgi:uncharacterized protein with HEPN domain
MTPNIFLDHILHSIELMEYYTKGKTKEEFLNSDFVQDAVIRRFKIIGEAAKRLPDDFKDKYPEIPWETIANVGNTLEKEDYDLDLIWATVENGVPVLKKEILENFVFGTPNTSVLECFKNK